MHRNAAARRAALSAVAAIACLGALAGAAQAKTAAQSKHRGAVVNVMSRNVYLGADLGPAIRATTTDQFIEANGNIVRQVEATNFPVRAKGLAEEILEKKPDLVGLQEVALWREAEPSLGPVLTGTPSATKVKYDFLKLLLAQLNRHGRRYRTVIVQPEFDFEAPADANGVHGDGPGGTGLLANAEVNGRLTMRDVILARVGAGVSTSRPESSNYDPCWSKRSPGVDVTINRGWAAVDAPCAAAGRSASSTPTWSPSTTAKSCPASAPSRRRSWSGPAGPRAAAAGRPGRRPQLRRADGNGPGRRPGLPGPAPGRAARAQHLQAARLLHRRKPLRPRSGGVAEFDHKVDHVMTNAPRRMRLIASSLTGRRKKRGYWDSDHNGLFSSLRLLP